MADVGAANRRGELRTAIEGLLRTCVDLERQADDAGHEARNEVNNVARALVDIRVPGLSGIADEIMAIGGQMETDLVGTLGDARRPYLDEVHELLGLLAPHHGVNVELGLLTPTAVAVRDVDTFANQFPAGFARTYVRDLIASVDDSFTLTIDEAGRIQIVPTEKAEAATKATGPGFADAHRDTGVKLLEHESCHAVEQHGPHIPDQAQLARLLWLKDPTGEYPWNVGADGRVVTKHWAGTTTGGFTSPEALAKPIDALLGIASERDGGLNKLLEDNAYGPRIAIHVSATQAGLVAGDASGFRGAGTGTNETRSDWIAARKYAIRTGSAQVHANRSDPIADGSDPGATLAFKKVGDDWCLVTCYPVFHHEPRNTRLEEL